MSRYARMAGRKKYPGHRGRMVLQRLKAAPPLPDLPDENQKEGMSRSDTELVAVGSRINGVVKSAISPEILAKTEGMPWHRRIARLHAITGIPFTELSRTLADDTKSN